MKLLKNNQYVLTAEDKTTLNEALNSMYLLRKKEIQQQALHDKKDKTIKLT